MHSFVILETPQRSAASADLSLLTDLLRQCMLSDLESGALPEELQETGDSLIAKYQPYKSYVLSRSMRQVDEQNPKTS